MTECGSKSDLQLLSLCGNMFSCLRKSVPEINFASVAWMLIPTPSHPPLPHPTLKKEKDGEGGGGGGRKGGNSSNNKNISNLLWWHVLVIRNCHSSVQSIIYHLNDNSNSNECISRTPFHVKHAHLCWTGANTKHMHITYKTLKTVGVQIIMWNIQLSIKKNTNKTQIPYQRTQK